MTASGSGTPGRGSRTDDAPRRGFGRPIILILAIGLIARLIMAYGFPPLAGSGFKTDLDLFRYWADELATQTPWGFYGHASYADYTPGYLYVLWLVGIVGNVMGGVGDLIKLPSIITDVALGWLVYAMARDLRVTERRATIAAAVVVLNPVTWFDSVVWGQVDSFGTVFLLLAVRELWRARNERAAILAVVAALIKPQLGILVPIVAVVVIRRALWPKGAWGGDEPPERTGFGWERRITGAASIVTTGIAAVVTAVILTVPFQLWPVSLTGTAPFVDSPLLRLVFKTAAVYPYLTVNAYNMWALFPSGGQTTAATGLWLYDSPAQDASYWGAVGPFPAALVGAALFIAIAVVVCIAVARRPDRMTILVGTCVLAVAFFAAPTRVHERYLFPLFGLAAILVAFSWRWRIAYALASAAIFLNMYVVLTTIYPDNPSVSDWLGIGGVFHSFWGVALIALANTGVLVWAVLQLRPGAGRALAAELRSGRLDAPDDDGAEGFAAWAGRPVVPGAAAMPGPVATTAGGLAASSSPAASPGAVRGPASLASPASRAQGAAAPPALVPAWYERPSWGAMGILGALRARIRETPIRPDRSASLKGERGGRIDRLDIWVVLVLVVAALCLRTWRLAEPARMHFDEVYHARTATEFLQDWRYGISHDIYEWTHPHLAKYAMALGIEAFAGHDVTATSELGVNVRDAAIEPRRADASSTTARDGDRVWVVTGTELIAYDLETRKVEARWSVSGASTVSYDDTGNQVFVGTDAGAVLALDTTTLDAARQDATAAPGDPATVGTFDAAPVQLVAWDGGATIAARMADGTIETMDATSGTTTGRTKLAGAADMAASGEGDAVTATLADVGDAAKVAKALAAVTGGKASTYQKALARTDIDSVVLDIALTGDLRTKLTAAITAGTLPGIAITKAQLLAVADGAGIDFLSNQAAPIDHLPLGGGAHGLAYVPPGLASGGELYATTTDPVSGNPQVSIVATSGDSATSGPAVTSTMRMPGAGTKVLYDDAAQMVEVLGEAQDGSGPTVYVIEPHGNAVFADHKLGFEPVALVLDHVEAYPSSSRGQILAFASSGSMAALDVGHYDFSWRLPGVILGALTVGALYLLTRVLFRRRTVGVLAGLFLLLDGMAFVQSRIAMNDVYTGFFIIAAYLLFAWLWVQPCSRKAFWTVMPAIGILLGLGLASKWVAAYAIGALGILVLARSALGRVVLIAGLIGLTGVLGWMALAVPSGSAATGNLLFPMIMIVLTLGAVAVTVYRPIAWSDDEVRFAVAAPAALGILLALTAIALGKVNSGLTLGSVKLTALPLGFGLVVLGGLVYLAFNRAGRMGFGPMAVQAEGGAGSQAVTPAPDGWLRLGDGLGLSTIWWAASLVAIPIVVYVISYLPWAAVENHQIVAGFPAGHTGQTLLDLTGAMYRYHNDLTAAHPASSPWWAWPLNLKPVWFYQGGFANNTGAAIYDAGNMVVWWLGIPAMAFVAWQGFRRRSLGLALILVGFLAQWVSWARIDRAAFQYHYYTSVPFIVMGLAYLAAELWHGASRRTWLAVRIAAALAVIGPALLWILKEPLCRIANVEAVNKGSQACQGNPGNLVVTPAAFGIVVVGVVLLVLLVRQLVALGRPKGDGSPIQPRDMLPLVATALIGGVALAATRFLPATDPLFSFPGFVPELIALAALVPLGLVAIQVLTARDARRFVIGLVAAVAVWFVILYPNISALPMPSDFANAYQGLLPTYLYPFQFAVNTVDRSGSISFASPGFLLLMIALVVASCVIAYSAWAWRQALAGDPAPVDAPVGAGPVGGGPAAGGPTGEAGAS